MNVDEGQDGSEDHMTAARTIHRGDVAMADDGVAGQPPEGAQDAPEGYEDLVRIDQGGFAIVYRARDTRFDRTVALKVLRSENLGDRQLRRFRAECLATGRVSSHPNIVTVYDAGTTRGHRPWLAMEYCSGGSLAHRMATQGLLPVAEVISIGARLCSALSAAHEAGILHRDVKPHNVLLTSYGEPALADFGIASVVNMDETGSITDETAAYTVVHAAPEILEGKAGTAAADIYSLGSTLYTLLAGQAPFAKEASTGLAPLVTRILSNDLPAITRPGVPPELEQLLRRSMAANPADRPATAAELGASLVALGRRLPRPPAPAPVPPAPTPVAPMSARRLLLILGGALTVLFAAFTAWGPTHGAAQPDRLPASPVAAGAQAAASYAPKNVVVSHGRDKGELIVAWTMPIRPDVVATVIYEGAGAAKARTIVNYGTNPRAVPRTTLRGLPSGRKVCLSAAHLVSLGDSISDAVGLPVCAVPR
jgi:tRNA A-37 threonylcarbamoyl transferase component Bud32